MFYAYMWLFKPFGIRVFYFVTAALYVILPTITFKTFGRETAVYLTAIHVSSISFWGYGVNGIRNGLATAIFLYGLKFFKVNPKRFLVIGLLAAQVHASIYLPLVAALLGYLWRDTRFFLAFWLVSITVNIVYGLATQEMLEYFIAPFKHLDSRFQTYSYNNDELFKYQTLRFRYDFFIYSIIPVVVGLYTIFIWHYRAKLYVIVLNAYLTLNAVWILLMYRPFTNRLAYLSWFLIPIVLYPFIQKLLMQNKSMVLSVVILMSFILMLFAS